MPILLMLSLSARPPMMTRPAVLFLLVILLSGCAHWRSPLNGGACPLDFPIKGNADSMYYHLPTDKFYYRTRAESCFDSIKAARMHGYNHVPHF